MSLFNIMKALSVIYAVLRGVKENEEQAETAFTDFPLRGN